MRKLLCYIGFHKWEITHRIFLSKKTDSKGGRGKTLRIFYCPSCGTIKTKAIK